MVTLDQKQIILTVFAETLRNNLGNRLTVELVNGILHSAGVSIPTITPDSDQPPTTNAEAA